MRLNKEDGIRFLRDFQMPTVKTMDVNEIISGKKPITKGLSVRLSLPRSTAGRNVYLPSIHNCTDLNQIRAFVEKYSGRYTILIHETVHPEVIGSVSRLELRNNVVLETYDNFDERKRGNIRNRVTIPLHGEKMMISKMEMLKKNKTDFNNFRKVVLLLKDIPFSNYDMEYVIQDGEVIFTELTLPQNTECINLKNYLDEENKGREI